MSTIAPQRVRVLPEVEPGMMTRAEAYAALGLSPRRAIAVLRAAGVEPVARLRAVSSLMGGGIADPLYSAAEVAHLVRTREARPGERRPKGRPPKRTPAEVAEVLGAKAQREAEAMAARVASSMQVGHRLLVWVDGRWATCRYAGGVRTAGSDVLLDVEVDGRALTVSSRRLRARGRAV